MELGPLLSAGALTRRRRPGEFGHIRGLFEQNVSSPLPIGSMCIVMRDNFAR